MTRKEFTRRFLILILITWTIPPVFGLSYLLYIQMFTFSQMESILFGPIEPIYCLGTLALATIMFKRWSEPLLNVIDSPTNQNKQQALLAIKRFPLLFWGIFLTYLVIAPFTVIVSAELYSDFVAQPIDWFRIYLVALVVSIIVGLPIFFRVFDLFGLISVSLPLTRPFVTIKTKVFMIGALAPLLIDTMIVQYYWTRTGYFSFETFIVWFSLELLAVAGSLIFVKSFSQSLRPLQLALADDPLTFASENLKKMHPLSTDELGILTNRYQALLASLVEHQNKLEFTVAERTRELEASNRELEAFSYSVSHDLRAPLRHIHGYSNILLEDFSDKVDDEMKQHLQRISKAADKMSGLIDSLLSLSRISRKDLQKHKVDLSVHAHKEMKEVLKNYPDLKVETKIESGLVCYCDSHLISVLLNNLFSNAVKFSRDQLSPVIEFGRDPVSNAFFVGDNGVGFNMEYADKIFMPFQRNHSAEEFEGDGIGLATATRVINKHGGKIWAVSQIGKGSRFYFSIPSQQA